MSEKKRITIQAYWGDVKTVDGSPTLSPEEVIKERPIVICSVIIDDEVVGDVMWDGERLTIREKRVWRCSECSHRFRAEEPLATIPVSVVRCPKCGGVAELAENNKEELKE